MAKKLLLIVNPNAGKMKAGSTLLDLVSEFSAHKYEVTVYPTTKQNDAEEKVAKYGGAFDLIVCYGGDGTLSEIVNGVMRLTKRIDKHNSTEMAVQLRRPVFSFVPSGTANDFAATVSMPTEINQAVKKIVTGKSHPIDIGRFNNRYFIYVAAFGLFTSVSYSVNQDMKKAFGQFSYVMEGLKQAVDIPAYRMAVEYTPLLSASTLKEGGKKVKKVIKGEFVVGLVTNTTSVAGMFKLKNAIVKLDDGKFELTLVRNPGNPILLSNILMDLSAQKYDPDYVIFERVSSVKFHCDEPVAWCLDGENGGLHKRVSVNNLHKKGTIQL